MRTAIISDIHGNFKGLKTVLADIGTREIERIVCLGDLVEGGNDSDRIVQLIREQEIVTVQGNHDLINDLHMEDEYQQWLRDLPEEIVEGDCIITHVSPRVRKRTIRDAVEAWNVFNERDFRTCFIGHTHMPLLFGDRHEAFGEGRSYTVDEGTFPMNPEDRYIASFGAIGYPRAGGEFLRYGIWDATADTLEYIKLNGPLLTL